VLLAEDLLAQLQRLPIERLGGVVLALALKETSEVIHTYERKRVLLAEDLLPQLQRFPIERLGGVILALVV
jgi:hypothetical protein